MDQKSENTPVQEPSDEDVISSIPSQAHIEYTNKLKFVFIGLAIVIIGVFLGYFLNRNLTVTYESILPLPTPMPTTYQVDPLANHYLAKLLSDKCASQERKLDLSNTPFKTSKVVSGVSCDPRDGSLHIVFAGEPLNISLTYEDLDSAKRRSSLSNNLTSNPEILIFPELFGYQEPCEPEIGKGVELKLIGYKYLTAPSGEVITVGASKKIVESTDPRLSAFLSPYAKETKCSNSNTYRGFDIYQTIDRDKLQKDFRDDYNRKYGDKSSIEELEGVLDSISLDLTLLPK